MFDKILVSIDGTPDSDKAVRLTSELARVHGSQVLIVHGRDTPLVNPSGRPAPPQIGPRETKEEAQELVDSAVSQLQAAGIDASGRVLPGQGHAGRKILKEAEKDHADLIVLGSRSMSRLEEVMIGSASNKIVHAAKCPVLLVR